MRGISHQTRTTLFGRSGSTLAMQEVDLAARNMVRILEKKIFVLGRVLILQALETEQAQQRMYVYSENAADTRIFRGATI
jgi:hypothetical protein